MGSANMDLVSRTRRLPAPGETVLGEEFTQRCGGKGANQAVAAARLGLRVRFAGAVGRDAYGERLRDALAAEGGDTASLQVVDAPTGVAVVLVDDAGENSIVVTPGANAQVRAADVDPGGAAAVLCQLEVPPDQVADLAGRTRCPFFLNAAPMLPLPEALLARCDLVVVNEAEYAAAAGRLDGCRRVAVTRGHRGAVLLEYGREIARAASPRVDDRAVVDTVGAGDAFTAALVHGVLSGLDEGHALRRACRAGALAVTRPGTQSSLPTLEEVRAGG